MHSDAAPEVAEALAAAGTSLMPAAGSSEDAVTRYCGHKASCAADGVVPSVAVLRDAEAKLANLLDEFGAADAELSSMMYGKLIFVAPDGSPKSLGAMHTFTKAGGVGALVGVRNGVLP